MRKTLAEFVDYWKVAALTERQGAQSHFIQLCDKLDEPRAGENDPEGERYASSPIRSLAQEFDGKACTSLTRARSR